MWEEEEEEKEAAIACVLCYFTLYLRLLSGEEYRVRHTQLSLWCETKSVSAPAHVAR